MVVSGYVRAGTHPIPSPNHTLSFASIFTCMSLTKRSRVDLGGSCSRFYSRDDVPLPAVTHEGKDRCYYLVLSRSIVNRPKPVRSKDKRVDQCEKQIVHVPVLSSRPPCSLHCLTTQKRIRLGASHSSVYEHRVLSFPYRTLATNTPLTKKHGNTNIRDNFQCIDSRSVSG